MRHSRHLTPFFVLIGFGLGFVFVLYGFLSWNRAVHEGESGKVRLFPVRGEVKFLSWGAVSWEDVFEKHMMLEGDTVRTGQGGRAVLDFYGDNAVRLDQNTEIKIETLEKKGSFYEFFLVLRQGAVWVNTMDADHRIDLFVEADDMLTDPSETVFSMHQDLSGTIRVLFGEVHVSIKDRESVKLRMIEEYPVQEGREIIIGEREIRALNEFRMIQPLYEIDDVFFASEWYEWNVREDQDSTDFSKIVLEEDDSEVVFEKVVDIGPILTVTTPENPYETFSTLVEFRGGASEDTVEIVVIARGDGYYDEYTLKNYEPGDREWVYRAGFALKNLTKGKNRYEIVGLDMEGNKGEVVSVIVTVR